MNRLLSRTYRFTLGAGVLAALLLLMLALASPAAAQPPLGPVNLDYDFHFPTPPAAWPIPPGGQTWHEMYPVWCTQHVQEDYDDNDGHGDVSVCDNIKLSGTWYHIEDVYPTYFFSPVVGPVGPQGVADPSMTNAPEGPIGDIWHIIHTDGLPYGYCDDVTISDWTDTNGNGVLDVCDDISFGGAWYHIDGVHCDITVKPTEPTEAKQNSWGWLKSLFNR